MTLQIAGASQTDRGWVNVGIILLYLDTVHGENFTGKFGHRTQAFLQFRIPVADLLSAGATQVSQVGGMFILWVDILTKNMETNVKNVE